jgi:hypothetical protein
MPYAPERIEAEAASTTHHLYKNAWGGQIKTSMQLNSGNAHKSYVTCLK